MGEDNQWPIALDTLVNTIGPGNVPGDHVYGTVILPGPVLTYCQLSLSNTFVDHGWK